MHHENADTRKHRHGVAWCESGAAPRKLRRRIAHEMRHGALKWRARRDRRTRDGGKRFSAGFCCDLPRKKSREPSVGDAERVSAREPPLGQFLACSALYEAGSAYRMQPYIRSNARAVERRLGLKIRYSVSDGPRGHCTCPSVPRVGQISRQFHRTSSRSPKHATDTRSP